MQFEKPGIAALIVVFMLWAVPVAAQIDLTGTWQRVGGNDNGASQEPVDLLGMPLSADGRAKALSYDIAALSATERQCQMYPPMYAIVGPFPLQFTMVPDPITQKLLAWKIAGWGELTIASRSTRGLPLSAAAQAIAPPQSWPTSANRSNPSWRISPTMSEAMLRFE